MRQKIRNLSVLSKRLGKGLKIEFKETLQIPSLLRTKEYKKAGHQVLDLLKMAGLAVVWIIPGGAVITAVIVKFSQKARPSAFCDHDEECSNSEIKKEDPNDLFGSTN